MIGGRIGGNKCISQVLVYVGQGQYLRRVALFHNFGTELPSSVKESFRKVDSMLE